MSFGRYKAWIIDIGQTESDAHEVDAPSAREAARWYADHINTHHSKESARLPAASWDGAPITIRVRCPDNALYELRVRRVITHTFEVEIGGKVADQSGEMVDICSGMRPTKNEPEAGR